LFLSPGVSHIVQVFASKARCWTRNAGQPSCRHQSEIASYVNISSLPAGTRPHLHILTSSHILSTSISCQGRLPRDVASSTSHSLRITQLALLTYTSGAVDSMLHVEVPAGYAHLSFSYYMSRSSVVFYFHVYNSPFRNLRASCYGVDHGTSS
jgi:hypothetical protein